jgi:hypothetical protein
VQRNSINTVREPLRSDAVLRSVQRVRRNSHRQCGSEAHAAQKNKSAPASLEIVHAHHGDWSMGNQEAVACVVKAPDEYSHSESTLQVPSATESFDNVEIACVACEVGVEVDCAVVHFDCAEEVPSDLDVPIVDDILSTRELLDQTLQPATAIHLSQVISSSRSSSSLPTPRRPDWEQARGHSKNEIEAVLGLQVVSERLRARHGKIDDMVEAADTWAKLAAAGA